MTLLPYFCEKPFPPFYSVCFFTKSCIDKCKWEGNFPSGLWWVTEVKRYRKEEGCPPTALGGRKGVPQTKAYLRMGSFLVENGRKTDKEKPWKLVLLLDCMKIGQSPVKEGFDLLIIFLL